MSFLEFCDLLPILIHITDEKIKISIQYPYFRIGNEENRVSFLNIPAFRNFASKM